MRLDSSVVRFGRPGVEMNVQHDSSFAVLQLIFLVNEVSVYGGTEQLLFTQINVNQRADIAYMLMLFLLRGYAIKSVCERAMVKAR